MGPGRATESIVLRVMTAADGNNACLAEGQAEAAGFDPATVAPHRDAFDWLVRFRSKAGRTIVSVKNTTAESMATA